MLLTLNLPRINEIMTIAFIEAIYADKGTPLAVGAKFMDVCVDLTPKAQVLDLGVMIDERLLPRDPEERKRQPRWWQ